VNAPPRSVWLFSRRVDLVVFLGSAAASMALLVAGHALGILHDDAPPWLWLFAVVFIDVAHVWSTAFRTYLDRADFAEHKALYLGVPIAGYAVALALYSEGELVFWRALAYLAVFHFVRQQWGWVARYRRKAGETRGRFFDALAIYTATLYPLLHWHLTMPKRFHWFIAGDFVALPQAQTIDLAGRVFFFAVLSVYALRSRFKNPGKDIVVLTTALCWYTGIVYFESDYAFTVTNVIIHGVPYFAIVYQHAQRRKRDQAPIWAPALPVFLLALWIIGFGEELVWDRAIWHEPEHRAFFGPVWNVGAWRVALVPLLALPQLTHYVLDGFVWRARTRAQGGSS
jgi:hypothetical protein